MDWLWAYISAGWALTPRTGSKHHSRIINKGSRLNRKWRLLALLLFFIGRSTNNP
jgi:hypothetical protein